MNHILPKEYLQTLEVLQDRALTRRVNEVYIYGLIDVIDSLRLHMVQSYQCGFMHDTPCFR